MRSRQPVCNLNDPHMPIASNPTGRKPAMKRMPAARSVPSEPGDPDRRMGGPRSLTRILGIFEVLSGTSGGLSLTELSELLGSPKSSLLHLLRPLVAEGYLTHESGVYRLGTSVYRLAAGVLANWNFPRLVRPFMEELARRTGETVLLGVLNREAESLTYVEIIDGPQPIRYHIPVGTTRTLYASAAGRLLLAFSDDAWRKSYLGSVSFKVRTATPITRAALRRDVDAIRRDRICCTIDLYVRGLSAIAAPVLDAGGRCIASISIAGPTDRIRNEMETLRDSVRDVAAKASGIMVR